MPNEEDWETPCSVHPDGQHCVCWYDGKKCCACGDPAEGESMAPPITKKRIEEIRALRPNQVYSYRAIDIIGELLNALDTLLNEIEDRNEIAR